MLDRTRALDAAAAHAERFLSALDERPVAARRTPRRPRAARRTLAEHGEDPEAVIEALAAGADAGIVASAGPRHFGFVIGGALPAALAADWLVSAWDQCAAFHSLSPAAAAIEEIAAEWTLELLGLPASASVGFVTGAQGANTTCLAAARHAVLARAGWDVERDGLIGAPRVNVVCGEQAHATIYTALRLLGLGAADAPSGSRRTTRAGWIRRPGRGAGRAGGPTIVCAQAGNVATGAFDPFEPIADACEARGAWLHVDGAFGLWAAAAPSTRALVRCASAPTRGRSTRTSGSTSPTTSRWRSSPTRMRTAPRWASQRRTSSPTRRSGTRRTTCPSPRGGPAPCPCTPRCDPRSQRGRGAGGAQLRAGAPHGRAPGRDPGRRDPQRRGPQPGAGAVAGGDEANRAAVAAVQCDGTCWLGGTEWQGQSRDAHGDLELVDVGRGRGAIGSRDHGRRQLTPRAPAHAPSGR